MAGLVLVLLIHHASQRPRRVRGRKHIALANASFRESVYIVSVQIVSGVDIDSFLHLVYDGGAVDPLLAQQPDAELAALGCGDKVVKGEVKVDEPFLLVRLRSRIVFAEDEALASCTAVRCEGQQRHLCWLCTSLCVLIWHPEEILKKQHRARWLVLLCLRLPRPLFTPVELSLVIHS